MRIQTITQQTGISSQTIRYYESIGLLPPPPRLPNGYRNYDEEDVERVRFVAGARQLGLSTNDIREILALRDDSETPCRIVLNMLHQKADEIQQRITELRRMETELRALYKLGLSFPEEDILGKKCICHLVRGQTHQHASVVLNSAETFPEHFNQQRDYVQLVAILSPT